MVASHNISIEGNLYPSIRKAARLLGLSYDIIVRRIDSDSPVWKGWKYTDHQTHDIKIKRKPAITAVYHFQHIRTGKFYIGSTGDFVSRKSWHLFRLRAGKHTNHPLQELWDEEGDEKCWKWVIFICRDRDSAFELEQEHLGQFRGTPELLNLVYDARSPITAVLAREGMAEKAKLLRKATIASYSPEKRERLRQSYRKGSINRWSKEGAKEAWRGSGNPLAKKVKVDGTVYGSVKDAQAALGINEKTIRKRANLPDYPNYTFDC